MTPRHLPTRPVRRTTAHMAWGMLALSCSLALAGCSFPTDTPLHVTDVARAVLPGRDVAGRVGYPDGRSP